MDQKLNETSILTYTLVNKSEAAYNFKSESKPKICELSQSTDTNGMSFVSTFGKSLKDKNDEVLSNKNVKTSIDRQNHTNDKCECWCFPWLLKKKSKEILLENNNTSSDTDDNIVKNSAI